MASKKDFIFSQKDLLTSSFSAFNDMKENGLLSDVTIRIGDKSFSAHRLILAATIPYFKAMFASNMVESENKEISIKELDPDAMEGLINFAYTNKLNVNAENVHSLLMASQFLQMTQVRDCCCHFLSTMLHPSNVMDIRALADSLDCVDLVGKSDIFIRENFDEFCQTKEFLNLSFPFLNELIRRDDLRVANEEKMFQAVINWVKNDTEVRHMMLPHLLTGIRMTHLTPKFLINKASKEKLIVESFPCRDLLDEAKHFYMLPDEMPSCSFSTKQRYYGDQFTSGIYVICSSHSAGLTIFKYNPDTVGWATLLKDKKRRYIEQVFVLGRQIFMFDRNYKFETFNPHTLEWTSCNRVPDFTRPFKYAVPFDNKICWLKDGEETSSMIHFYDPERNSWYSETQNIEIFEADVFPSERGIYVCGTSYYYDFYGRRVRNRIFNPQTKEILEISEMENQRHDCSGAALKSTMYLCGGYDESGTISTAVDVHNYSLDIWSSASSMNTARKNFSLVAYSSKLYAVGGVASSGRLINSFECYDPATQVWTLTGFFNGPYDFVKAVAIADDGD